MYHSWFFISGIVCKHLLNLVGMSSMRCSISCEEPHFTALFHPTLPSYHIMDMWNWTDAGTFLFLMSRFGLCGFTWLNLYIAFAALKLEVRDRCLSRIMREDRHLDQLVGGEWPDLAQKLAHGVLGILQRTLSLGNSRIGWIEKGRGPLGLCLRTEIQSISQVLTCILLKSFKYVAMNLKLGLYLNQGLTPLACLKKARSSYLDMRIEDKYYNFTIHGMSFY